ncbi:ubiquinol-cytochrome C reductase hinge domain-containing protein [Trametes punicea]|nr:ubiquinol-cytochrome C reductase hinge domain-containing protein [Trametes punicea]
MSLSSFFSSFLPVVHADAPEEKEVKEEQQPAEEQPAEEESADEPQQEEAEEEEPEDPLPALQEECAQTAKCAPLAKHFQHCEEKVHAGQGYKGEDCVEEFYHMMHCVNGCVAPKLFAKLK